MHFDVFLATEAALTAVVEVLEDCVQTTERTAPHRDKPQRLERLAEMRIRVKELKTTIDETLSHEIVSSRDLAAQATLPTVISPGSLIARCELSRKDLSPEGSLELPNATPRN
jgi:hypothetical protein